MAKRTAALVTAPKRDRKAELARLKAENEGDRDCTPEIAADLLSWLEARIVNGLLPRHFHGDFRRRASGLVYALDYEGPLASALGWADFRWRIFIATNREALTGPPESPLPAEWAFPERQRQGLAEVMSALRLMSPALNETPEPPREQHTPRKRRGVVYDPKLDKAIADAWECWRKDYPRGTRDQFASRPQAQSLKRGLTAEDVRSAVDRMRHRP